MNAAQAEADAVGRVVIFDLDGVLSHHDTMGHLVRKRLLGSWWRLALAVVPLLTFVVLSGLPRLRAIPARWLVRVAWFGSTVEEYEHTTKRAGSTLSRLTGWPVEDAVSRVHDHQAAGHTVYVVTASERSLATAYLKAIGVRNARLFSSKACKTTFGVKLDPHNFGKAKVATLTVAQVRLSGALLYTDSISDAPLAAACAQTALVNPTPRTMRWFRRHIETIQIERWI